MEPAGNREYEFDRNQNTTISRLASAMKFCAIFELVIGILYGVFAMLSLLAGAIGGVISNAIVCTLLIVLAVMQSSAAGFFRNVATTQGSDIMNLMFALDKLRGYFSTKRVLYIIVMCLVVVLIVFVVLFGMSRTGTSTSTYG